MSRFQKKVRRIALYALMASSWLGSDLVRGKESISQPSSPTEDLCGWVTHDSIPFGPIANCEHRCASEKDISVIKAEPPAFLDTCWNGWCEWEAKQSERQQITELASLEPVDTDIPPVGSIASVANSNVADSGERRLVGSAPIIVTLDQESAPLPLQFYQSELPQWLFIDALVMPACNSPSFVSRSDAVAWNNEPATAAVLADNMREPADVRWLRSSADCLLDELCYDLEVALEDAPSMNDVISPQAVGAKIANLTLRSNRWVARASKLLASIWPEIPANPSPARRMIARADAIDTDEFGRSLAASFASLRNWLSDQWSDATSSLTPSLAWERTAHRMIITAESEPICER
jgi:hypothetical protein